MVSRSVIFIVCNFQKSAGIFWKFEIYFFFILTESWRCLILNNFSNKTSTGTPIFCYRLVTIIKIYIKYCFYRKKLVYLIVITRYYSYVPVCVEMKLYLSQTNSANFSVNSICSILYKRRRKKNAWSFRFRIVLSTIASINKRLLLTFKSISTLLGWRLSENLLQLPGYSLTHFFYFSFFFMCLKNNLVSNEIITFGSEWYAKKWTKCFCLHCSCWTC